MSDAIVEQTRRILDLLLDEEGDPHNPLECDSDSPDKDVILIALRLREFGDTYNDLIQREMKHFKRDLQSSFAMGQGCEMFSEIVNQLSENQILKRELSQMSSEMGLLKIVVLLGLQAAGELPNMVPAIKNAMADFLNTRLLSWIQKSGGWNAIKIFREKGKEWEEPSKTMIPNIERSSTKQISGNHCNLVGRTSNLKRLPVPNLMVNVSNPGASMERNYFRVLL